MDTLIDTVALKRRHAITAATDVGQNAPPDFGEGQLTVYRRRTLCPNRTAATMRRPVRVFAGRKFQAAGDDRQARPNRRSLRRRPTRLSAVESPRNQKRTMAVQRNPPHYSARSAWTLLRIPTTRASAASSVARSWTVVADMRCS